MFCGIDSILQNISHIQSKCSQHAPRWGPHLLPILIKHVYLSSVWLGLDSVWI